MREYAATAPAAVVRASSTLTLAGAQQVLDAAATQARSSDVPVCIAVCDAAGILLAFARLDGAPTLSITLAQDKAYTVTAFNGLPTDQWYDAIQSEPALLAGIVKTDRLVVFGGGKPIHHEGVLIGAIGVSGGSAEQDTVIAAAGAAALA